jgi:antitoxin (DNA-binding transcriptional repressor) of toxin-antitoxin stability system
MAAGEFKAKCLAVMDQVHSTGEPVLITKRGKPVARVVAPNEEVPPHSDSDSIFGFMRGMGNIPGDVVLSAYSEEEWALMFGQKWDRLRKGANR